MAGALADKRVLVVEDEYFIASDLDRALRKEGAVVLGPVGDLARGMSLLAEGKVDGAILDVNLAGGTSLPIADSLEGRSVPYMFLTGYDRWALPDAYHAVPRIVKPFSMRAVLSCLEQLVAAKAAT